MRTKLISTGTHLYKSVSYNCEDIFAYMQTDPSSKCKTNKMIWLAENEEGARSYGSDIKYFKVMKDLNLLDLVGKDCGYDFSVSIKYDNLDSEFRGKMNSILNFIAEREPLISQCYKLYSLLTGFNFTVGMQLETLKGISESLSDKSLSDYDLKFEDETIAQMKVTPDGKSFKEALDEYIEMGENLDPDEKNLKNQRLSIYVLDQILLKLICINENLDGVNNDINGWYVPDDLEYTTVWKEIVNGNEVFSMGEIALFNTPKTFLNVDKENQTIIECDGEYRASLKKKKRKSKKKKKRKSKKKKKFKRKNKSKRKN